MGLKTLRKNNSIFYNLYHILYIICLLPHNTGPQCDKYLMKNRQNLQYKSLCLSVSCKATWICVRLFPDTMTFNLSGHNNSLLCEVNVTHDPGFVLTVFHDGYKLQTGDSSASGDSYSYLPFVTLSEAVLLRSNGTYECQLHLNEDLITASIFHYHPPGNDLLPDLILFFMHAHNTVVLIAEGRKLDTKTLSLFEDACFIHYLRLLMLHIYFR